MNKSNLVAHAEDELRRAGLFDNDSDRDRKVAQAVMELIEKFSNQNHSGFSSRSTIEIFHKLSQFHPLTPLTGEDGEWVEIGKNFFRNKRCSGIFKTPIAGAWDIAGMEPITFPYTPGAEEHNPHEQPNTPSYFR